MDKYTYNLKADKIQKLVRQGDYATAAKIADTMEWKQERSVRLLTAASEAYEKMGQYQTAIDLMLAAYDQAAVGKRMLYKLTELAIKNDSMGDAETFYKKYLEEASEENNRYILRYLIAEAKEEPLDKKIRILETYRKHEFEEKWACRLAELYHEAGREKECVALCDEIILWFGVGQYVDRAMELKETYQPLTESQRDHRENRAYYEEKVREVAKEMEEALEKPLVDEEASEELPKPFDKPKPAGAELKPVQTEPKTEAAAESPAETSEEGPEDELPLPKIAISEEVAAAFGGGAEEQPEIPEEQPEISEEKTAGEPENEAGQAESPAAVPEEEPAGVLEEAAELSAAEEMFEENPKPEPEDPDQTKRLNLYTPLRSSKLPETEELAKTQEFILPSQMREQPQVEHVTLEASEEQEEEPDPFVSEEETGLPAGEAEADPVTAGETETPDEDKSEETSEEILSAAEEPVEEAPSPAETEDVSPLENDMEEPAEEEAAEEEKIPLEKDANVLPVLSYEETEKAVWEDQNRRMEEREPLEIHEMEHCIFVSAANSAEGVNKAVEALGEHYRKENRELSAIAKITGEKLNRRGLVRSLPQLKKKDLIIDEAGKLDDAIIAEMLEVLEYLEPGKVFVLLETPAETETLRQRVRSQIIEAEKTHSASAEKQEEEDLPKIQLTQTEEAMGEARESEQKSAGTPGPDPDRKEEKAEKEEKGSGEKEGVRRVSFANLSEDQVLSEKDFLRYAEYFARELECSIDQSGLEAIKDECRLIRQEGGRLTVGEAEAIVEDAAEHAEKHTVKRLFSAKYDKEGYLILRKRDFA